jgi:hypothetical protein
MVAGWLLKVYLVTPTGIEQPSKSLGKSVVLGSVPPPVPPSGAIELLAIWAELDEPARRDLLAVARGWVKVAP